MCEFEWQYADNITILTWSWGVITLYSFLKSILNWFAHACSPNQGLESPLQHRYMLTYLKYGYKGLQNDQNGATDAPKSESRSTWINPNSERSVNKENHFYGPHP